VLGHSFVPNTRTKLASFPIGIDAKAFADYSVQASTRPEIARLRASVQGAKLAIGVDRIDYSKGLDNRLHAFDRLFHTRPELKRQLCLLQIALPSRGQIAIYGDLQAELATLVSDINGRHGEIDWIPIRYLTKGFPQSMLAGLYRTAQVGLVTPLHDGMNLVAKEYVAAQNPLDPGVLVLSKLAGAAQQLDAALLVNPHDVEEIGQAICTAMTMGLEERCERWQAMIETLQRNDIDDWFANFISALDKTSRVTRIPAGEEAPMTPAVASAKLAGLKSS